MLRVNGDDLSTSNQQPSTHKQQNLDELSYRFSIMHKIELPDAPIGGFKKNMEVTRTLFMSIFKETTCSKFAKNDL